MNAKDNLEISKFRTRITRGLQILMILSIFSAAILPSQPNDIFCWIVTSGTEYIPYAQWVFDNSAVPYLASAWVTVLWLCVSAYWIYLFIVFPFGRAGGMAAVRMAGTRIKNIKLILISLIFLSLAYNLFFERNFAKSVDAIGFARKIEVWAIGSRFNLICAGWLIVELLAITGVPFIIFVSAFFARRQNVDF